MELIVLLNLVVKIKGRLYDFWKNYKSIKEKF